MVSPADALERAWVLHQRAVVIDTHCDTTQLLLDPNWRIDERHADGHVDLPRLREGRIDGVFLAVYATPSPAPGAGVAAARTQINHIEAVASMNAADLALADSTQCVRQAELDGKVAILIGLEGGYLIEDSLDQLREFRARRALYLTLTHGQHTTWADSSGIHDDLEPLHGGLTPFGRDVVRELNRLGMMVDVSHASDDTVRDVLETSAAPVIASHSSCRAVSPHRRNLSDELIKAIAATGGVVQINFSSAFIDPDFPASEVERMKAWRAGQTGGASAAAVKGTAGGKNVGAASGQAQFEPRHSTALSILADHFEHALSLVGPDHVGIGSDFDGVLAVPEGMEDCSRLPHLTAELLRRGHSEADLTRVLGANVLRVMDACASVGRRLSRGDTPV